MKVLSRGTPKKEGIERWDGEQAREARSGKPEIPPRFQKVKKSSQDQPFILILCHLFFCLPAEGENTANGSFPNRGEERLHKKHRHWIWNIPPGAQPLGVGISHSPFFHGLRLLL